jgi:DNA polymerase III delta subunit
VKVRFGVYSGDPLLAERRLEARLRDLGPVRREAFFADEITPERLLLEVQTPDLFGESRAVVVRWADPWRGERELAQALRTRLPDGSGCVFLGPRFAGAFG